MKLILTKVLLLFSIITYTQELTSIKVIVPNETDEVYIVGNQECLGNWNPSKVRLQQISDFERQIEVPLTFPAEFKFTKGSWEKEGIIKSLSDNPNQVIHNKNSNNLFVIKGWSDAIIEDEICLEYDLLRLNSAVLEEQRTVKLVLPENYQETKKYPVVYITDASTENFNVALSYIQQLMKNKSIPEVILVGITQNNRNNELDIFWSENGKRFKDFLFNELIPHLDENFTTSGFNAIIGHSDGAEYNHLLMLEENNPFRAFINISTNLNNDVSEDILEIFKTYTGKPLFYYIANAKYDSEDRIMAGNKIDSLYKITKKTNIYFSKETFNADHQNVVSKSLFDGINHIFQDYRDLNKYKNFKDYGQNYETDIFDLYGFKPNLEENDIDFYFGKILDNKKLDEYEYLINFIQQKNISFGNNLDRANHYFYMEQYPKAIEFWNKTINNFDSIEPRVFYFNFTKAIDAYLIENRPLEAIHFLEKSKAKMPQYSLEYDYFIAKTAIKNHIETMKGQKALKRCKKNFNENRYFSEEDIKELEKEN